MKIEGYWNIYTCGYCGTEFAISQLTDKKDDNCCPNCEQLQYVDYRNEDLVERI